MGLFEILTSFALVGRNFKTNVFKLVAIDDAFDRWNRGVMVFVSVLFGVAVMFHHWMFDTINCLDFQYVPYGGEFPTEQTMNFQKFAEEYCWAYGMYTVREAYDLEHTKTPFPGIIPEDLTLCVERELVGGGKVKCPDQKHIKPFTRIYLRWYPMIIFYFWIAASLYYFPWRIYKLSGLRKVKDVVTMLQNRPQFADDLPYFINRAAKWLDTQFSVYLENKDSLKGKLVRNWYFGVVVGIKIIYLLVSVLLLYYTNKMFDTTHQHDGTFVNYGTHWLSDLNSNGSHYTPIQNVLFPKMVACEVKRWGTTGIEEWQGMCVLAGNVLYQWLFLIYWLCLVISIFLNCIATITTLFSEMRLTTSYSRFLNATYVEDTPQLRLIYENIGTSGRVILRIIGNNVFPSITDELVRYMIYLIKTNSGQKNEAFRRLLVNLDRNEKVNKLLKLNPDVTQRIVSQDTFK